MLDKDIPRLPDEYNDDAMRDRVLDVCARYVDASDDADLMELRLAGATEHVCPLDADGFPLRDDGCTLRERIVDRIANLLHLAHACGVEVDDLCATARMHFDAEAPDTYVYREE